ILALRSEGEGHEREDDQRGQPETQHASECGGRTFKPGVRRHVNGGGNGRRAQTLAWTKCERNSDRRLAIAMRDRELSPRSHRGSCCGRTASVWSARHEVSRSAALVETQHSGVTAALRQAT